MTTSPEVAQAARERAGITKRLRTRNALLNAADLIFTEGVHYSNISTMSISKSAKISNVTFYTYFQSKDHWGVTIFNTRLNDALGSDDTLRNHTELRRVFEQTADQMPGITLGIVGMRALGQPYNSILPDFHDQYSEAYALEHKTETPQEFTNAVDLSLDGLTLNCVARAAVPHS